MDATDEIKAAYAKEKAEGRTLLVYVGASWCEPCQRFHHAVESKQLDSAFPRVSFLEFDSDRDGEALANAGYFSRLIPLIALPGADGKASGKQIEGGIKGDGAVNDITPRLKSLLGS
jgi:thiol-disulfide isomerase/thioredoxin